MVRKEIRPSTSQVACDICGRTLLRGELAEIYVVGGGDRRQVCELCTVRADHEGWLREKTGVGLSAAPEQPEERGGLFARLVGRRERAAPRRARPADAEPELDPALALGDPLADPHPTPLPHAPAEATEPDGAPHEAPELEPERSTARRRTASRRAAPEPDGGGRGVRAVPTASEQRMVRAVELFNESEHPRTVAGVARALGGPIVAVRPQTGHSPLVEVVVSWELCWYRYEIDLTERHGGVRVIAQGYELDELLPEETTANAAADERGTLQLAAAA